MNIGIIGCGFIGTTIGGAVQQMDDVKGIRLLDADYHRSVDLGSRLSKAIIFPMKDLEDFVEASDLVVEAASQEAVKQLLPGVLEKGKDVLVMSVGALVDDELWSSMQRMAREKGARIYIPSGAVGGIDGLISGSIADIDCVTLTVIKPPGGLSLPSSMHHLSSKLGSLEEPLTLFEGTAREAVSLFPKNVNVAATIALAGIGFDRTRVKVVADPRASRNRQRIDVRGRFGEMSVQMMNQPSTTNPRTSYMAPLSAIAVIRKILSGVSVGN